MCILWSKLWRDQNKIGMKIRDEKMQIRVDKQRFALDDDATQKSKECRRGAFSGGWFGRA